MDPSEALRREPVFLQKSAELSMIDEISAIEDALFSDPWSRASLRFCMENPVYDFTVALDTEGAVAGFLIAGVLPPEIEISTVAVRGDLRRQGIGRSLLGQLLEKGAKRGCDTVFLEVRASNRAAIGLYRSLGFEEYGVRKRYYSAPVEDAILMRLLMNPTDA